MPERDVPAFVRCEPINPCLSYRRRPVSTSAVGPDLRRDDNGVDVAKLGVQDTAEFMSELGISIHGVDGRDWVLSDS